MNERIRDLFETACFETEYDDAQNLPEMIERFAELIVGECAEVVQEGRWMVQPSQEQLARSIRQHFEVE